MSSDQRDQDKNKRPPQQPQTQFKHHWEIYQAKQQATQMGLTSAHMSLTNAASKAADSFDVTILETMQRIWMRRGAFDTPSLANVFLQQTENLSFFEYKKALVQYLWTAIAEEQGLEPLKQKIEETLAQLWTEQDHEAIDSSLKLRTCNRLISLLTTQGYPYPSPLFTLLAVQEQYDILGLVLLRLMLLSRPSYQCFADAIDALVIYYEALKNPKSNWLVDFLRAFKMNVTEYLDRDFEHKVDFTPQKSAQDFR